MSSCMARLTIISVVSLLRIMNPPKLIVTASQSFWGEVSVKLTFWTQQGKKTMLWSEITTSEVVRDSSVFSRW